MSDQEFLDSAEGLSPEVVRPQVSEDPSPADRVIKFGKDIGKILVNRDGIDLLRELTKL